MRARVHRPAQMAPHDDAAAGDDLRARVDVPQHDHVAGKVDAVSGAQGLAKEDRFRSPAARSRTADSFTSRLGSAVSSPEALGRAVGRGILGKHRLQPHPAVRQRAAQRGQIGRVQVVRSRAAGWPWRRRRNRACESRCSRREGNASSQFPSARVIRRPSWMPLTLTDTGMMARQNPRGSPIGG